MMQLLADYDLERMKKNGPKDVCYASLFNKDDTQYIPKLNPDNFFLKMEQKWNDHNPILEADGHRFEFLAVSKADDVVTYPGLSFCMQQIVGTTATRWRYMAAGSGLSQARPYQQGLDAETFPRADMTVPAQGSINRVGEALQFLGIFPASFPTISVRESAVTQAVSGTSIFLTRNMFSNNTIVHTSGGTAFTLGVLITFSGLP